MTAPAPGPVSAYVRDRMLTRLRERRVVLWYDPHRALAGLLHVLGLPGTTVVSAANSALRARREAEAAYPRPDEPGGVDAYGVAQRRARLRRRRRWAADRD